ncbi:C40 family peptidase [Oscillibacter sp. MSJ-31]|uniref:C40 family peptidase n=1 Tax=Oscillibacter sp. MSJ-31 TaxID=2841526 RepID=UPI001C0FBEFA|nr:C40 family peptidase [Oscillibacter sp. MSJ-31]MBU5456942.1 C40 family peptidase [Oscillibacter sp. MSJ-31]
MPKESELKARDKVVMKMTRDGAVEENLTEGTSKSVTGRTADAELVKPVEASKPAEALSAEEQKKVQMRRQQRQFREEHTDNTGTQPTSETTVTEEKKSENPPQNAHEAVPVSETPLKLPLSEQHSSPSHTGAVIAETVVMHKLRKTSAVEAVDADAVLSQAAETAAEAPIPDISASSPKMHRLERKSQKAHERLDAAREKLPTHKVLKKERVFDEASGKGKTRLHFEDELKKPKQQSKLSFETEKTVRKIGDSLGSVVHGKLHEVEQDNAAVEGAHKTEIVAETAIRHYSHHRENSVNKPYEKVSKLEHKAETADAKLQYEKNQQEHPELHRQNMNRHYQKQNIKKEYAAARKAGSQTAGTATKSTGKKAGEKAADKLKEFFEKNKKAFLWIGVGLGILVFLAAGISSCSSIFTQTGAGIIASSYLSEDDAMLGAEEQYCRMEQELQRYLDTYESTHDYDEYHFDLDDIEHDPYVLISILSALHEGEFTLDEVQGTLQMLFDKQYILTEEVIVETRYRTETDTWTDSDGNTHTETYRVPYDYYICYVTLENFNLSHVPVYIMSQDELSLYATYMSGLGNREDLFPNSDYVDKYITNPPADYDVNPEYLNDEKFATLIEEAEKYIGYPYVWGGSNPDTSFDCSGFVSYVFTNSGLVNTGRLGAQGLYNVCTPVSKANAKPGDLIFFVGTYDTPGVSHVGIYVGDGVMLHCGDPIQYTSINSSYWQQHFYAFGRPNY